MENLNFNILFDPNRVIKKKIRTVAIAKSQDDILIELKSRGIIESKSYFVNRALRNYKFVEFPKEKLIKRFVEENLN